MYLSVFSNDGSQLGYIVSFESLIWGKWIWALLLSGDGSSFGSEGRPKLCLSLNNARSKLEVDLVDIKATLS
jgi:hypothetical protein